MTINDGTSPTIVSVALTEAGAVYEQADQPVADALGHWAIARSSTEAPSHVRKMQRQIVEDTVNTAFTQKGDQTLPHFQSRQEQIEHMIRLLAMLRDERQLNTRFIRPIPQAGMIQLPDLFTVPLDSGALLELSK